MPPVQKQLNKQNITSQRTEKWDLKVAIYLIARRNITRVMF